MKTVYIVSHLERDIVVRSMSTERTSSREVRSASSIAIQTEAQLKTVAQRTMFGRANATPTIKPTMKASSMRIRIVSIIWHLLSSMNVIFRPLPRSCIRKARVRRVPAALYSAFWQWLLVILQTYTYLQKSSLQRRRLYIEVHAVCQVDQQSRALFMRKLDSL